jgi:sigma-E factor negative regulatory protein RseA
MESIMSELDRAEKCTAVRISALVDGELQSTEVAETCRAWRTDAQLRADWHTYSLIGDVLRSADLARTPARAQAFLGALRERLALEPVVPAPISTEAMAHTPPARAPRPRWVTPLGIAAGVAMVAGLAWTMRPPAPDLAPQMARAALPSTTEPPPRAEAAGGLAPDTRQQLEPYLSAHRMVAAKAAFGPAPGFMRSVAHEPDPR